jgi:predicted MFS family arabinose efflux permease
VGGLLYGALKVPGSPSAQLFTIGTALVVTASLVALTDNGIWLSVILGFAGLFFSPVMIVAYLAAHTAAAGRRQNAATTWVNTSHNLGSTVIIAVAGILIQYTSVPISTVVIGTVSLLLLAVAGALSSRRGHATPADMSDASMPPGRGLADVD